MLGSPEPRETARRAPHGDLRPTSRRHRRLVFALLASAACVAPEPPSPPPRPPDILLVSIDTLRADHLGCYGYSRDTSPRLDRLAGEALLYEAAYAPTPWTFPSHASMLTGMHPYSIGIDNSLRTIPDEIPIVAELLQGAGYQTAAFVDSSAQGFVGQDRGFGRGFDAYANAPHRQGLRQRFDMAATVDAASDWLERRDPARPFFLFLHTKAVHAVPNNAECLDERCSPYEKPLPWQFRFIDSAAAPFPWTSPEDGAGQRYLWSLNAKILAGDLDPSTYPQARIEALKAFYDAGIYYVDWHLGRLFDDLAARDLFDRSLIVITSDHGESFLDHSLFMHQEVYDTLLRVPLIVRLPGASTAARPSTIDHQVALADIAPTLLQLAGARFPEGLTGRPLPLAADDSEFPAELDDELAYYLFPSKFSYQALALRRGDWKLVVHNPEAVDAFRLELYNTADDPGEREPVADQPELREDMRLALRRRLQQTPVAQGAEVKQQELPNLEAIRSLGYIE